MPIKKSRSLNDTVAIANSAPFADVEKNESRSTSLRKIDNGYVTSESSTKDGRYEFREYYSEKPPSLGHDEEPSTMRKAVDYMKRNGSL